MQVTLVTKAQWDDVRSWGAIHGYTDLDAGYGKASSHPLINVTWRDVIKWCNASSEKDGLTPCYMVGSAVMRSGSANPTVNWTATGYRLPTEAEWEKAARGGVSGKRFPWGADTITHNDANYNSVANSYSYDLSSTHARAGNNAGCVIERSARGFAIRRGVPVGKNDWVVCATNDYLAIRSADVSDLPSEIGATSCDRYDTVINGLRNARLGLGDAEMVGVKDVRRILRQTQFGCTVHSTVFDASDSKELPWE